MIKSKLITLSKEGFTVCEPDYAADAYIYELFHSSSRI
jgi:hypothetical protein